MNIKTFVLQTDGIEGDLWICAYKSEEKGDFIVTMANRKGVMFTLPKDAKPLFAEGKYEIKSTALD